jgi:hypothetical protein
MSDFAAVLRNAIDGLNDNRPAIRQKIYERARLTLATRLESVGPAPEAVVERHKRVLEHAIAEVESEYGEQPTDPVPPNLFDCWDKVPSRRDAALQIDEEGLEAPRLGANKEGPQNIGDINGLPNESDLNPLDLADFEVRGEATIPAYDQPLTELFSTGPEQIESIAIGQLSLTCVQEIAWAKSSLCGLCEKWALCIDQTHCWHRAASAVALRHQA